MGKGVYKRSKLVYGVGINDVEGKTEWKIEGKRISCPYYGRWRNMLKRCYCIKALEKQTWYEGAVVCDEWLYFSKFKAWMEQQDWEGLELDKDILFPGRKVYSPETCVFIPRYLNNVIGMSRLISKGAYPLGVCYNRPNDNMTAPELSNPYFTRLTMHGKDHYLGHYKTPLLAHHVWQKNKANYIWECVEMYKNGPHDIRIVEALMLRVTQLRKEIAEGVETVSL